MREISFPHLQVKPPVLPVYDVCVAEDGGGGGGAKVPVPLADGDLNVLRRGRGGGVVEAAEHLLQV